MSDLESRIRHAFRAVDTVELDRRVDEECSLAPTRVAAVPRRGVPWWATAAACFFCGVLGVLAGRASESPSPEPESATTVVIDVSPEFEAWLVSRVDQPKAGSQHQVYDGVQTVYVAGQNPNDL